MNGLARVIERIGWGVVGDCAGVPCVDWGPTPIICVDFELRVNGLWLRMLMSLDWCHTCQQVRQKYLENEIDGGKVRIPYQHRQICLVTLKGNG